MGYSVWYPYVHWFEGSRLGGAETQDTIEHTCRQQFEVDFFQVSARKRLHFAQLPCFKFRKSILPFVVNVRVDDCFTNVNPHNGDLIMHKGYQRTIYKVG